METVCGNCGIVLTSTHGKRIASAHFDSSLPHHVSDGVVYARCESCYNMALRMRDYAESHEHEVRA